MPGPVGQPRITGRRVREVWISKKKWQAREKRVADLEEQVQGQPDVIIESISKQLSTQMAKSIRPRHQGHESQSAELV